MPTLVAFAAANFVFLAAVSFDDELLARLDFPAAPGWLGAVLSGPILVGLVVAVGSWFLPTAVKETLVTWRVGPARLPSCAAFSKIARADERIDLRRLERNMGELPKSPREQTAKWYEILNMYRESQVVEDAHRAYLKFRELTALTSLMVLIFGLLLLVAPTGEHAGIGLWLLAIEYLVLLIAARNAGRRLVANVLAIHSARLGATAKHLERVTESNQRRGV